MHAMQPSTYRTKTTGITTCQFEVLTSPIAKAYFTNIDFLDNLRAATQALRAALSSANDYRPLSTN